MATLCSTLKYYGHAVIGVVRDADKEIIIKAVRVIAKVKVRVILD
jgi:hypothetical protein